MSENFFIKLFVFGKSEPNIEFINQNESDLNEKLLPLSISDTNDQKLVNTSWLRRNSTRRVTLLLYCFIGLQVSYLSWGLLQEKIMTTEYVIQSQFFTIGHNKQFDQNLITISRHLSKGNVIFMYNNNY